ncbi:AHA1, activator of heat shock 90kDa protein ATPase [Clonorchis sinensis]|uniref:AHA1, activator of heat shock 90kDa protein ATPase n=1 Tax=Clonorchis sinensis TaxID=79923 RepID=A0A8T1MMD7_CLOSI|nr:AHA1, activator of heat shock 90kDa protein ATPase [Clonorchis sinensis]
MAKWGEGDPRWIVEERADAKNVNNWHWTEKNATQWSIDTIKKLLGSLTIDTDEFLCSKLEVTKCEGEAHVNNRKGKLISFYEWQIEAEWSGTRKTGDNKTKFKGKVEIPNLSEEYSVEELDVSVTCTSSSADGDAIRNFMQTVGAKAIKEKLGQYLKLLHEEYSRDLILPTKGQNTTNQLPKESSRALPNDVRRKDTDHSKQPKDLSVREIHLNDEFFCTPDDLYKVLTTKELVQAFTRGEATVNAVQGGEYCIFGGNISGTFTSLTPGKSIEMQWRKREWPESHHSILCIELNSFEGGTQLKLSQKGIPAYDVENTKNGWQSNFFASVKQTYGYGGRMF